MHPKAKGRVRDQVSWFQPYFSALAWMTLGPSCWSGKRAGSPGCCWLCHAESRGSTGHGIRAQNTTT